MSMWTLTDAVATCRHFEGVLKVIGFHVALGGSCLYRGKSDKDTDIFVYPHRTNQCSFAAARAALATRGVKWLEQRRHEYDHKEVWRAEYLGKRIDFFFVK